MPSEQFSPERDQPSDGAVRPWDPNAKAVAVGSVTLHIYALFAIAVSGPMFARLQSRTQFLVSLAPATVMIFVILGTVVVPAILVLIVAFSRRRGSSGTSLSVHAVVATMSTLILLETFSHRLTGEGFGFLTLIGCLIGGYFCTRLYEWPAVQSVLSVAAFGSLLFPISLLATYFRDSSRPVTAELKVGNPVPVVMVVFDCLCGVSLMDQSRMIDAARYPNFAELARTSSWYRNCTSVHPRTDHAVPAILAGELHRGTVAPTAREYPQSLFTLLEAGKYKLTAFEPFTSICPTDMRRDRAQPNPWTEWIVLTHAVCAVYLHDLIPPDLPIETPRVPRAWFGMEHVLELDRNQREGVINYCWDIDRPAQFAHFLSCLHDMDQPNLWFGHFALPHFPWNYLPSGSSYRRDSGIEQVWGTTGELNEIWAEDDLAVLQGHQQYLLQLGYTDRLIGDLIRRLRETGLYDRCLLVVVADHGIAFKRGLSGRQPSEKNLAEIMSVPLFIKLPDQQSGDVVDLNVATTDVLPTMLDVLKLSLPKPVQGRSLIDPDFTELPTKQFTDDERNFTVDAAFEGRNEVLAEQLGRFGTGSDPLRIYRIGPHSELMGQRIGDLNVGEKSSFVIHPINFVNPADYETGKVIPALLRGVVSPAPSTPLELAIAVNDTIQGTTKTFSVPYLRDFCSIMLPESAFSAGPNQIRYFQIVSGQAGIILRECSFGEPSQQSPPAVE